MSNVADKSSTANEKAAHTPGPWRVDGTNALGAYGVWTDYATHPGHDGAGYPSQVCSVFQGNKADFDRETRDANARLLAAAPDLLAALKPFLGRPLFEGFAVDEWNTFVAAGREAIAKAEGRQ